MVGTRTKRFDLVELIILVCFREVTLLLEGALANCICGGKINKSWKKKNASRDCVIHLLVSISFISLCSAWRQWVSPVLYYYILNLALPCRILRLSR